MTAHRGAGQDTLDRHDVVYHVEIRDDNDPLLIRRLIIPDRERAWEVYQQAVQAGFNVTTEEVAQVR